MDGLRAMAGVGVGLNIGGTEYQLAPLTFKDHAVVESHLLSKRRDPIAALQESLSAFTEAQQQKLMEAAIKEASRGWQVVTGADMAAFLKTHEGVAFTFWLSIKKSHPELNTFAKGQALFDKYLESGTLEQLARELDRASGLSLLKNSPGQTEPATEGDPHESRGIASIAS